MRLAQNNVRGSHHLKPPRHRKQNLSMCSSNLPEQVSTLVIATTVTNVRARVKNVRATVKNCALFSFNICKVNISVCYL